MSKPSYNAALEVELQIIDQVYTALKPPMIISKEAPFHVYNNVIKALLAQTSTDGLLFGVSSNMGYSGRLHPIICYMTAELHSRGLTDKEIDERGSVVYDAQSGSE